MIPDGDQLSPDSLRSLLAAFWSDTLEIAAHRRGLTLAVPLCYPDGWQVILELSRPVPGVLRLSDHGRTLQWLEGRGQNLDKKSVQNHLRERCTTFGMRQDGIALVKELPLPLDPASLQLFAEALVGIAYLYYLHKPAERAAEVPVETIERVFAERHLSPRRNHPLDGKIETGIRVDYYLPQQHPVALQILAQRGNVRQVMEQWGFRWTDLRNAHPKLRPAMVYDPDNQRIDPQTLRIGESVCDLFCPYHETAAIHEFLGAHSIPN